MDDLGIQRFCDCADGAGIKVTNVRSRVLQIQKLLFKMHTSHTKHEVDHRKKAVVAAIADMSFGLERFAGRSASAISGATYVLSAVLPRMSSLGDMASDLLGLTSSLFVYFEPDEENTLLKVLTYVFDEFFYNTGDTYVSEHKKNTRDIIVQKKYFMSGLDSKSVLDAEIGVVCQVIPAYIHLPVFRVLEIRISDHFAQPKWASKELLPVLMYLKIYCQLTALKLVLICNAHDIFNQNPSCMNLAGGYSAAILEQIRISKNLLAPLMEEKHHMILANVGPINWPDIYSFLPLINIKCNNCADWVINNPVYPPGAVLAGRMKNGTETFIGRVETQTEILIGQIYGNTFQWIGNLSEYIPLSESVRKDIERSLSRNGDKNVPEPNDGAMDRDITEVELRGIKSDGTEDRKEKKDEEENEEGDAGEDDNNDEEEEESDEEDEEVEEGEEEEEDDHIPADVRSSIDMNEYQILCISDPRLKATWRPNVTGVPEGVSALRAGRDMNGSPFFVGRMFVNEEPAIGPVCGPYFYYVADGKIVHELDEMKYEVLCLENL